MAKVTGPLFSIDARGTLADVLSYQRGFGKHRVMRKPGHRDAETALQQTQRAKFEAAIAYWKALSAVEKAGYNVLADPMQMTGYQYVLKLHMLGRLGPPATESDNQVDASENDAQEAELNGAMVLAGTYITVRSGIGAGLRLWGGVRFDSGPFPPKGSTVEVAHFEIHTFDAVYDNANFEIFAHLAAAPGPFTTAAYDISGRPRTSASVPWVQDGLPVGWNQSASLVPVIQEVVNDYSPGSLVLILKPKSDTAKTLYFHAFDEGEHNLGAKLHLEWSAGGEGPDGGFGGGLVELAGVWLSG